MKSKLTLKTCHFRLLYNYFFHKYFFLNYWSVKSTLTMHGSQWLTKTLHPIIVSVWSTNNNSIMSVLLTLLLGLQEIL